MGKSIQAMAMCILTLLSACGGGGGGGSVGGGNPSSSGAFATTPVYLPDLKSAYDSLCGSDVHMQNIVPLDINMDGRKDLIINLWCPVSSGNQFNGPTVNSLIVLLQNADGSFVDGTSQIFGGGVVSLGGVGIRYILEDFNLDGYKDLVYVVNLEDGRAINSNSSNTITKNAVLMSDATLKTYSLSFIGQDAYNVGITTAINSDGTKDLVFMPSAPTQVFGYILGTWSQLQKYSWFEGFNSLFFNRVSNGVTTAVVANSDSTSFYTSLWKLIQGTWVKSNSITTTGISVPWISWDGNTGTSILFSINGNDYVGGGVAMSCELMRSPVSQSEFLELFTGNLIPGGYKGGAVSESNSGLVNYAKLQAYGEDSSGMLKSNEINITNEVTNIAPQSMQCVDVNGDGFQDVMLYRSNDKPPAIYMNLNGNSYSKVNDSVFPASRVNSQWGEIYEDINGDGIRDLIYFPISGVSGAWGSYTNIKLPLYFGLRNLNTTDAY